MQPPTHQVIRSSESWGCPNIDAKFGRITVIIGANGTGKSSLLNSLSADYTFMPDFNKIARHSRQPAKSLTVNSPTSMAGLLCRNDFEARVHKVLFDLLKGLKDARAYANELESWDGQPGTKPTRGVREIEKLFSLFSGVFPSIRLRLKDVPPEPMQLVCNRNGSEYDAHALSDGERETLFLLAALLFGSDPKSIFLVDEPELHLHASLADWLWTQIESDRPGKPRYW